MLWFYPPIQVLLQIQMFPAPALSAKIFQVWDLSEQTHTPVKSVSLEGAARGVGDWSGIKPSILLGYNDTTNKSLFNM